MTARPKPPKDPELDAAVLRVPHWRALGLVLAGLIAAGPVAWHLAGAGDRSGLGSADLAWLDGSNWRVVEVERRALAREGAMAFDGGRLRLEFAGCAPRVMIYRPRHGGIELLPDRERPAPCAEPAMSDVWQRLPAVEGLTRYATGLALTDREGRSLVRLRR